MSKHYREQRGAFYYVTLYRLEGHTKWRGRFGKDEDSFDRSWEIENGNSKPAITERRVLKLDRMTGEIVSEKTV